VDVLKTAGVTAPTRVLLVATYSQALSSFVAPFARYLEERGYEVTLAASDEALVGPSTFPQLDADGFRTRVIPFTNRMRPDRDLLSAWHVYRLIRRERFDVVHTFTAKAGFLGRVAARLARTPVVVHTAFSFPHLDTPEKAWLYGPTERLATRASDHVFCISDLGHRQTATLGVSPRSGFSNPGIGLDLTRFDRLVPRAEARAALGLPAAAPLAGTAARLVAHKRVDLFLDACRRIADRLRDAEFVVLGDGPERAALRARVTQIGLDGRVRFLDRLSATEVVLYFRALDLFMLPTEREGFGMVFAEAMSQETPAIGPDRPPVNEIIGDAGVLIDPAAADPAEAYAGAALALFADPARRQELGAHARRRILDRFDERRSFRLIEDTYRRLLENRA
jgi:glycosyltransferase involved in cell wall biosynthesis